MASLEHCETSIRKFHLKEQYHQQQERLQHQCKYSRNSGFQDKLFKNVCHQVILVSLFICSFFWMSSAQMVCQEGIKSFTGVTYPRGDIILKQGDTLDVYCSVDLTHPKAVGYNSNNLVFEINKHEIPKHLIEKTIINETTIRMRVEKMNASIIHLACIIRKENGQIAPVCQNHVEVGFLPLKPEDFRCIAWNWTKLVCTWRKPYNPVTTKYSLSFVTSVRNLEYETPCPRIISYDNKTASCEWNKNDPPYKPNEKIYSLRFNGTNSLNKAGLTWVFRIDHYSIVVPEQPEKLNVTPISPKKLLVSYSFKNFEHFPPGLDHKITVCTEEEGGCDTITFSTPTELFFVSREIDVPYAYTMYRVTVRMRSQTANKTEDIFWSTPVSDSARTMEIIPDSPPRTDIGSFEVYHNKLETRDVYVYWEQIPSFQRNGPNFRYETILYQNGNIMDEPVEMTLTYAKYIDLGLSSAFVVDIYAANAAGRSLEKSSVIIPNSQQAPKEPRYVSKSDYGNGTYEVTWTPPIDPSNIVSYTVFRCNRRRHQCDGILKWDVVNVGNGERILYQNLSRGSEEVYQFAVSANSLDMSSGFVWATCFVNLDKVPERLKTVRVAQFTEDEIHVEWDPECSYRQGVIHGFKIVYCEVDDDDKCASDNEKSVSFTPDKKTYTLKNLKPYTKYMIAISVLTAAGESQQSRPIYQKTSQAAPSDPPTLIVNENELTNTSALVSIDPPSIPNGIIRTYNLYFNPAGYPSERRSKVIEVSDSLNNVKSKLEDLMSSTKYSIQVEGCTIVSCSRKSDPVYVMTKIGSANITKAPTITYKGGGNLKISWESPKRFGGPINRFQVFVKQNDHVVNETQVNFTAGRSKYVEEVSLGNVACDSEIDARVRAVTINEQGAELFGEWSQAGYVSCAGETGWVTWTTIIVVGVVFLVGIIVGVIKFWSCCKEMKNFDVKLPPGLQKELNPFNQVQRKRKNSIEDVQPFGKESMATYPLKYTPSSNGDEEQGILPSNKNNKERNLTDGNVDDGDDKKKTVVHQGMEICGTNANEETSFENEITQVPWWQNMECETKAIKITNSNDIPALLPDKFNSAEDCLIDDVGSGMSPSALNPLLSDRAYVGTDEEESLQPESTPDGDHYTKLGMFANTNGNAVAVLRDNGDSDITNNNPINFQTPPRNDYSNQMMDTDDLYNQSPSSSSSLSPNSPEKVPTSTSSRIVPDVLTMQNNASYVKWTQLLPEFKNESITNTTTRQTPYCQVGIL